MMGIEIQLKGCRTGGSSCNRGQKWVAIALLQKAGTEAETGQYC